MRRFALSFGLSLLLLAAVRHTSTLLAANYSAGWNLISGPTGSHVSGALGPLYTLQPGDTEYESSPSDAPLQGCVGYWAYFPSGGTLTVAPGLQSCSASLVSGQWSMVGNPSASSAATATGSDIVLTYTPGGDYQSTTTIPAGQGAWATGDGPVTIATQSSPAPQAPPAPLAAVPAPVAPALAAAPALPNTSSFSGLKAAALNAGDLLGFTLHDEGPFTSSSPYVATYSALWVNYSTLRFVDDLLTTSSGTSDAQLSFLAAHDAMTTDYKNFNIHELSISGIGDAVRAVRYEWYSTSTLFEVTAVIVRRGLVVALIRVTDDPGTVPLGLVAGYAQIIDARLSGRSR